MAMPVSSGPMLDDDSPFFNVQVWGISETRDQNYRSNARPRLRLADLLTEVVFLQLRHCSERYKCDYWFIILARFR